MFITLSQKVLKHFPNLLAVLKFAFLMECVNMSEFLLCTADVLYNLGKKLKHDID